MMVQGIKEVYSEQLPGITPLRRLGPCQSSTICKVASASPEASSISKKMDGPEREQQQLGAPLTLLDVTAGEARVQELLEYEGSSSVYPSHVLCCRYLIMKTRVS